MPGSASVNNAVSAALARQNSADVDSGHFEKEVLAEVAAAVAAAAAVDGIVAGGIALAEPDSDYFPPPVEML